MASNKITADQVVGKRFGRLFVLSLFGEGGKTWVICRCRCGNQNYRCRASVVLRGIRRACGCRKIRWKHGHCKSTGSSPEHLAYMNMLARCYNPKNKRFRDYGGRGVKVHRRWRGPNGFIRFFSDVGSRPSSAYSIDRFPDKNGNYEPGNVRWATRKQQQRNLRNNRMLTFRGKTRCVSEWAEVTGFPRYVIAGRMRLGWDVESILTTKPRSRPLKERGYSLE